MKSWVIQENLLSSQQIEAVSDAVHADGGTVFPVTVIPFSDNVHFYHDVHMLGEDVVIYGSAKLSKLAYKYKWGGLFFNDNFDTGVWNKNRDDMLNQNSVIIRAGDAIAYFENNSIDDEELYFIRPVLDLKAFAGGVQSVREIKSHMGSTQVENYSFDADTMVSIAVPQVILAEWRFFIVNGKVIDGSRYRKNARLDKQHVTSERLLFLAQQIADKWLPHPTCVMDLALPHRAEHENENSGLKVIEFNCINSSGFYDNDVNAIVKAINRSF